MSPHASLLGFTAAMSVLAALQLHEVMLGASLAIVLVGLTRRAACFATRSRVVAAAGVPLSVQR